MKYDKWDEKTALLSERLGATKRGIFYQNTAEGVYFTPATGEYIIFLDGRHLYSYGGNLPHGGLAKYFEGAQKGATLAERRRGILPGRYAGEKARNVSVFTNENGSSAVLNEKFCGLFPKDALYYVSGPRSAVPVGIMDGGTLRIVGIVCPIIADPANVIDAEAV